MPFNPKTEYTISPKLIPIGDFYNYTDEFVTRPPYQRKSVWSTKKKQALLDSLFRRYYIPKIVIREVRLNDDRVVNEVVDGQQRIIVAQEFFANKLKLPKSLNDIHADLAEWKNGVSHHFVKKLVEPDSHKASAFSKLSADKTDKKLRTDKGNPEKIFAKI